MSAPTQIDRPFRVKVEGLGDDDLLLDSFTGSERVSDPFRFVFRVLSANDLDMQSMLGSGLVFSLKLDEDTERHIHGNINRMKLLEYGDDGMAAYEVEVVPWFWFLTLFSDCRIFQNMSVPDIVKRVFSDRGFSNYELQTTGTYAPREYCVQYRETDFNFVSRLLEEEGIFYFFEQTEAKHTLVLGDDATAFTTCTNQATAVFTPSTGGRVDENTVFTLESEYRVKTATATLTDYNFTTPAASLLSTLAGQQSRMVGEAYDYPGYYSTKDDGSRYARLRLEELETNIQTIRGDSNCMGFECGYKFTLQNHVNDKLNQEYITLGLEHHGRNPSYRSGSKTAAYEYAVRYEAILSTVVFRPARRARKPVVEGPQTAVVAGKSGEEIWCDQYGRVKVQFFWDRMGTSDENSSCWIRVAQPWAGKEWGFITLPRMGQEVVVTFLDGDPDRPLITGSVYNADQMPPYALPDNQTQSTWKSMSSKGGDGFNEIRFEDNKGKEQIFVHGEKDMDMRIKNDRREWIGEDRHLVVVRDKLEKTGRDSHLDLTRDLIEKVGRDHHLTISGKEAISVTGSHSFSVTGDVIEQFKANHSSQVTQNLYLKALQVVIEASVGMTLKVGGNFITIDPTGVAIKGTMVQINSAGAALSGSAGSAVSPLSPTDATDASDATPGAVTSITPGTAATPASTTLNEVTPATPGKKSAASDAPTHDPNDPANQDKTHYIEITLVDQEGNPIAGEPFKVTLADGTTVADGTTDEKGYARVDNIDPGTCKVTFPQRDKTVWKPK
ncbi:MAG TPA: type VI secretion system tip protein TssI/VgrG [Bryobacteraceae bacterium]|nr:type VI secretion system tip protein TssI/VgrG [Bryobacteraceae bacterium]